MRLTFHIKPTPTFDEMSPLLVEQLGPLIDQARQDGPEGYELFELFDVLDDEGTHLYDLHLFCGDDGQLHRTGTTEHVATFSQGGPTGSTNQALLDALGDAYERYRVGA
jgi:hypothetical protein